MILALALLACTGSKDDTGPRDTSSDAPAATTAWYFGTSDGQTPDGSYVAPTDEILFIRALDPVASTVTESAWTVVRRTGAVSAYELVHSVDIAKQFIERAKTSKGLHVTVSILEKVYATGRKCAEGFKQNMRIVFDEYLPKWNYLAIPQIG